MFFKELTEPHVGDAYRRELQDDKQPYSRAISVCGSCMACRQVLEREHSVDDYICSNTCEYHTPRAKSPNDAREEHELENAVQTAIPGKPKTDGRGTKVKPAQLDWGRPDERDKRHRRHVEQGEHSVIRDRYQDWLCQQQMQWHRLSGVSRGITFTNFGILFGRIT